MNTTTDPVLAQAPVAASILDLSGQRVARNPAYWSLFGIEPPSGPRELLSIPTPGAEDLERLASGDVASLESEHDLNVQGRNERVRAVVTALRLDDGAILGLLETLTPVAAPVTGAQPAPQSHSVDTATVPTEAHGRVLVVEDSRVNQIQLTALLKELGYQHELAGDGAAALELAATGRFDAVMLDWHLPDIEGPDVARQIRETELGTGNHLPIIAVTARAMVGDREECLDAGMDDFLNKPVTIELLGDALGRLIGVGSPEARTGAVATSDDSDPPTNGHAASAELDNAPQSNVLVELTSQFGDPDMVASVVETYLVELPGHQDALRVAAEGSQVADIERIAHTLKSTSAMLGANALADQCGQTETAAARGSDDLTTEVATLLELADDAKRDLAVALRNL